MVRPRTYKTEAVVLRQMPFGEADRILTLYTPGMGKLHSIAKGVRRTRSRLGGNLELLNCVQVALSLGRSLDVITEVEVIHSFRGFRDDLHSLSRALYVSELVDRFTVEKLANYAIYQLLFETLMRLGQVGQVDLILRYFELHLLEYSGYKPELYWCVECRARLEQGDHYFSTAEGGILGPECRVNSKELLTPISLNGVKVLRFLQDEMDYGRAEGLSLPSELSAEIERLLRSCITFHIDTELRTIEFMKSI